jgi:hypothetical protein
MVKYILKQGNAAFVRLSTNDEYVITPVVDNATLFDYVGDAMKVEVSINDRLRSNITRFISMNVK